jgi:hypothetical protein
MLFFFIPGWVLAILILILIYDSIKERERRKGMDVESIRRENEAEKERARKFDECWNERVDQFAKPFEDLTIFATFIVPAIKTRDARDIENHRKVDARMTAIPRSRSASRVQAAAG